MPFFDQTIDPTDPNALAALRVQQAIAQSAMPTPYRTPLFSAFGNIAGARADAAEEAMKNQAARTQQMGGNLGLLQSLQQYNLLAPYMGGQPMTMDQLAHMRFGQPGNGQPPNANQGPVSSANAPFGMPSIDGPTTVPAAGQQSPQTQGGGAGGQSPMAQAMIMRMLGFQPTDYQRAKFAADMLPAGPQRDEAEMAAAKAAGIDVSSNVRSGGVQTIFDPNTRQYKVVFKNPTVPEGFTLDGDGNVVPLKRGDQQQVQSQPGSVAATNVSNFNLGNLKKPGSNTEFQSFGNLGEGIGAVANQIQKYGSRGLNTVGKIVSTYAPPSDHNDTQAYIADVAKHLGVDPDQPLNMSNPLTISALTNAMIQHEQGGGSLVTSPAAHIVASPMDTASPAHTPVQYGAPDIPLQLGDFENQAAANGLQFHGLPDAFDLAIGGPAKKTGIDEMVKSDADRLEKYSVEQAEGQKVYTNLQQLYQIMNRGLNSGHLAETASEMASAAQQMGLGNLIPKGFDPNNADAFNKLSTDLVFAQLKQIPGQPRVTEIEGLKKANPNLALTPQANNEIMNNILAEQRWKDARANLANQFFQKYGQLGSFDSAFNRMYPERDVYNAIAGLAAKQGWKLPGDKSTPSGSGSRGLPPEATKALKMGHITTFKNGQKWTLNQAGEPERVP